MKPNNLFVALFKKYPLFRLGSIVAVIFLILGFFSLLSVSAKKVPVIHSVNPPVGSPGDLMIIEGENFGNQRSSSDYVQVGASRITNTGYLSWSDTQIKILLPSNVTDGLVIVATKSGQSKPGFFANEAGIPVEVPPDTTTSMPVIAAVTPEDGTVGSLITISGTNFGTIRNNALVYFTADFDNQNSSEENVYIPASEDNYDYEYWSDSEIHVRIPDGASAGQIYVQTEKGISNLTMLEVKHPAGFKNYSSKKTYLVNLTADIQDINSRSNTTLSLHVPRPPVFARQPAADMTECSPEPVFDHYQNTIIHQLDLSNTSSKQIRFNHSFVIDEYSFSADIIEKNVKPFTEKARVLYTTFTSPDSIIKCDDEDLKALTSVIIKKETNPYTQAKLIYNYMLENYTLLPSLRKTGSPVKDLVTGRSGDAYDFAIIYTTLLRCAGIPAIPVSGILVDADLKSTNHWWCEFYIENAGWIPADPALGAGHEYKAFKAVENPAQFYFGGMDSQHIAFSRGFNEVKPSLANSHIVYREKSYALQSIWEESSSGTVNYSSLWTDPVVAGIY